MSSNSLGLQIHVINMEDFAFFILTAASTSTSSPDLSAAIKEMDSDLLGVQEINPEPPAIHWHVIKQGEALRINTKPVFIQIYMVIHTYIAGQTEKNQWWKKLFAWLHIAESFYWWSRFMLSRDMFYLKEESVIQVRQIQTADVFLLFLDAADVSVHTEHSRNRLPI